MIQVIKFTKTDDIEKYGDSYLINMQNGVDEPMVYAYSPKCDCYLKRGWNYIKFAYFLDDKGYKYLLSKLTVKKSSTLKHTDDL